MLARLAAKYRLMLNFHGCMKPSGTSRCWPHVMTYEAVMGGEYLQNFSTFLPGGPDAAHHCTLPFTRNVMGPMDFTPVTYDSYLTGTTDPHQTALTVIFTSYVLHVGEKAENVLKNPCRPFLEKVKTSWDETRLVDELMNHTGMREYHHHHDMHRVRVEKCTVRKGDRLFVPLNANGGFALYIKPSQGA